MERTRLPMRGWHSMGPREQAVWGAAYALAPEPGEAAAARADDIVSSLAGVEWPESEAPEHRAARLTRGLTFDEFRGWYVIELRLQRSGRPYQPPPTEQQITQAYNVFLQCGSDFY